MRLLRIAAFTSFSAVASTPLFAFHELAVLRGGTEVCLNGARFTAKLYQGGFDTIGVPTEGYVLSFGGPVGGDPVTFTYTAVGQIHRFEARYPNGTFKVGDTATLVADAGFGASLDQLAATVENCTLLENGEFDQSFTTGWTGDGSLGQLTDTSFDYDGNGNDDDANGYGSFVLLSTHRTTSASYGNVDGNLSLDWDRGQLAQTFAPKYPCRIAFVEGFYTSETDEADDFWRFTVDGAPVFAFSNPGAAISDYPDDGALDGISRAPSGLGGDLGASVFGQGGFRAGRQMTTSIGGGAVPVSIAFEVFDEFDGTIDSGLLVDQVVCESQLLFASGFETGNPDAPPTVDWDAAVGVP